MNPGPIDSTQTQPLKPLPPLHAAPAQTAAQLWREFVQNPARHPNIPDCSYAGYAACEKPLPTVPAVTNVRLHGAKADGQTDDTAAFNAAIAAAARAGGGAVWVPAGTYRLAGVVYLNRSGVVLRGDGPHKTILEFTKPLDNIHGPYRSGSASAWSWCGGLLWVGPTDVLDPHGRLLRNEAVAQHWEYWRAGPVLARVTAAAAVGEQLLQVDNAAALTPGTTVLLTWDNPPDHSLLKHIAGFDTFAWENARLINATGYPQYRWPVRLQAVLGNHIRLHQPLRVAIRPEWNVRIEHPGLHLTEVGVEHLSLKGHAPRTHQHLTNAGWNALYVNRVIDGWVRQVEIQSMENGIILASTKHVTVTDILFSGVEQHHHTMACRVASADNLFQNFRLESVHSVQHGLNVEWFSSGNVWRNGRMRKGTLDAHRGLPFDNLRTVLVIANDSACSAGGDEQAGPQHGKRMVHWNVRVESSDRADPGEFVNQPAAMPFGALVGIQGAPRSSSPPHAMPGGCLNCRIADEGRVPDPPDLFAAQLRHRLHSSRWRPRPDETCTCVEAV